MTAATMTSMDIRDHIDSIFDRTRDGRYFIIVEAYGVLEGIDAARAWAQEFRAQHPDFVVEQRNTKIYLTVPVGAS